MHYLVNTTIEQMELGRYKHKLAMQLSGGMKRKLCVAIALIGDPKAGLRGPGTARAMCLTVATAAAAAGGHAG